MTMDNFLNKVEAISALSPQYKLGHSGDDGFCDCIGLIIGACQRCGYKWPGIHGSNWAARNAVDDLEQVKGTASLGIGDIVFKAREPSDTSYALPERYADSVDRLDYYHVGVVTSTSPLTITHCTGPGIVRDTKLGKWKYHGRLKYIDDGKGETIIMTARVFAESGGTVNLRASASTSGALVIRVPVGSEVCILSSEGNWSRVQYAGKSGYMMNEFLIMDDEEEETWTLEERVADLEDRVSRLEGLG